MTVSDTPMTQATFDLSDSKQELSAQKERQEFNRSDLKRAQQLGQTGHTQDAIKILTKILQEEPHYFAAWTLLGQLHLENGDYSAALNCLIQAFLLNTCDASILFNLGRICNQIGDRHDAAIYWLQKGLELDPENFEALLGLGDIFIRQRRYKEAAEALGKARNIVPDNSSATVSWALCMSHLGQREQALGGYLEAYRLAKAANSSANQLASILNHILNFDINEINIDLGKELKYCGENVPPETRNDHYYFALARYQDKIGAHEDAWKSLQYVNEIIFRERGDFINRDRTRMALHKLNAKELDCSSFNNLNLDNKDTIPIFILGASRAGKTTLETTLQSSALVQRGFERNLLNEAALRAKQLFGLPNSADMTMLPDEADSLIRHCFLSKLDEASEGSRFITMTDPGSISYVGRYARIIDNAVFIFLTRDTDDQALRIFGKLYNAGNDLSYSISTIYEMLDWYSEMINIWKTKLYNRCALIKYEELVSNPNIAIKEIKKLIPEIKYTSQFYFIQNDCGCAEPYKKWLYSAKEEGKAPVQKLSGVDTNSFGMTFSYKV